MCVFDTLKKNSRHYEHFAPFEIFQRPVGNGQENPSDISVGSRASGLRNDRWARVFSPVSEKVSFFSPPRYRRMCEVIFHFLRAPSVIDHFFPPSMIDKIIIIIIVVVIVAIRTRIIFRISIELFDNARILIIEINFFSKSKINILDRIGL